MLWECLKYRIRKTKINKRKWVIIFILPCDIFLRFPEGRSVIHNINILCVRNIIWTCKWNDKSESVLTFWLYKAENHIYVPHKHIPNSVCFPICIQKKAVHENKLPNAQTSVFQCLLHYGRNNTYIKYITTASDIAFVDLIIWR